MPSLARLALLSLIPACAVARADTLSTFNINGSSVFYGMAGDSNTITGSATIDVTTGLVQSIAFTAGGLYESGIDAQYGNDIFVGSDVTKFTVTGTSLIGFTGDNFNLNGPNDLYVGQLSYTGSSDPVTVTPVAVTPEPSSLLLLSTGLLGFAIFTRRRTA